MHILISSVYSGVSFLLDYKKKVYYNGHHNSVKWQLKQYTKENIYLNNTKNVSKVFDNEFKKDMKNEKNYKALITLHRKKV